MPYENTPRVTATFQESGLLVPVQSSQDEILFLSASKSGRSYEKYFIGSIGQAETEFGGSCAGLRSVYEAFAEGADNLSFMRIGGKRGSVEITASGESLTLTPWDCGDEVLNNYVPFIIAAESRFMVFDYVAGEWIYDSEEILVQDDGDIELEFTPGWMWNYDLNASVDLGNIPAEVEAGTAKTLSQLLPSDFTPAVDSVDVTPGDDGMNASLVEKYAALAKAYHLLNFRDADIVVPAGVYIDDLNIARMETPSEYGYYWPGRSDSFSALGVPAPGSNADALGYVCHIIYQGSIYTFFADDPNFLSESQGSLVAASSGPHFVDLQLDVQPGFEGVGGNACTFEYVYDAAETSLVVSVLPNANGGVDIKVTNDGTATQDAVVTEINTQLATVLIGDGSSYDTVVVASGSDTSAIGSTPIAKVNFTGGVGGHGLMPEALTGEETPAAVMAKIQNGPDYWFRETSFDHQLATFCNLAGEVWSTMHGSISTKAPPTYGRSAIAKWVGDLPVYSTDGIDEWIESAADDGNGILGLKLYAGEAGYRGQIAENAGLNNGIAGGGLIATKGTGLPTVGGNLGSGFPYGINDGDEALDENGSPVDIGKWLISSFDWPLVTNGYQGGSSYRTPLAAPLAGLLAQLPANKNPIGLFGQLRSVGAPLKIHPTQLDMLAKSKLIGTRFDPGIGITLNTGRTSAMLTSDYTNISTSRSVAQVVSAIRTLCKPYLGRPFNAGVLASLEADIEQYLSSVRGGENGLHQGAIFQLTYTRRERILGQLEVRLRMVPPFSINEINVFTSLAADESEL